MADVMANQASITEENYRYLSDHIHRESGILLDNTKLYLLQSRLQPVMKDAQLPGLNELCNALRFASNPNLKRSVIEAMTTHETLFFRDTSVFDALRSTLFPELIKARAAAKRLSIWSAASSSGQEAYSVAMMLLELGLDDWQIDILGTDLSNQILDRARAGRFHQIEVNRGLPTPYLLKYFTRRGLEWQINENVRKCVRFQQMDLRNSRPIGQFDVVFCRNVLIYFDVETRKTILANIRRIMMPGGVLLLGAAETLLNMTTGFDRKSAGACGYYAAV